MAPPAHFLSLAGFMFCDDEDKVIAGALQGCLVQWNPTEGTFDCPCHGSAFSRDGACIQVI